MDQVVTWRRLVLVIVSAFLVMAVIPLPSAWRW
jgi:hypothetical protein